MQSTIVPIQTHTVCFRNKSRCPHCNWVTGEKQGGGVYEGLLYFDTQPHGVCIYRATNSFNYAFLLVNSIHSNSNNVFTLFMYAVSYAKTLTQVGLNDVRILLNSGVNKHTREKEHQHIWIVADTSVEMKERFDLMYNTVNGYDKSAKQQKEITKCPYDTDIVFTSDQFSDLINPLQIASFRSKNFYIFAKVLNGECNEFTMAVPS